MAERRKFRKRTPPTQIVPPPSRFPIEGPTTRTLGSPSASRSRSAGKSPTAS